MLTTAGMAAKLLGYRFHRIVVDEVHAEDVARGFLFSAAPPAPVLVAPSGFRANGAQNYECTARHVWLLSGTPMTRGAEDLQLGAHLLGHAELGLRLHRLAVGAELLAAMRTLCIRHLKAQIINHSAALTLPASKTKIVWLNMTHNELSLYRLAEHKDALGQVRKIECEGAKDFFLEMVLRCRRQACSNVYKFSGQQRAFTEAEALLMYARIPSHPLNLTPAHPDTLAP